MNLPKDQIIIDTSDITISRQNAKARNYLKKFLFTKWRTGKPLRVCSFSVETDDRELLLFRDKKEVSRFAKWLLENLK